MKKLTFTKSENFKEEYCCSIIKIGEVKPIPESDFLGQTLVNGLSAVVRKDQVKEGDILIYAANETELSPEFLSVNNLYEVGECDKNANYNDCVKSQVSEVETIKANVADTSKELRQLQSLLKRKYGKKDSQKDDAYTKLVDDIQSHRDTINNLNEKKEKLSVEIKKHCGFFNKYGRVKMIRLKGVPSMGFLFGFDELTKTFPDAKVDNVEDLVGTDFDTVCDKEFVKAYIPRIKEPKPQKQSSGNKHQKKVDRFDRIIPGEFLLHYDTQQLPKNIGKIKPDDVVTITVKMHGTSFIAGKVKTKIPLKLPIYKRLYNKIVDKISFLSRFRLQDYYIDYDDVYSSRTVIKNKYINPTVNGGFYKSDVWGDINDVIKPYLENGMTIYGEICGYVTNSESQIQKGYDYECNIGDNFLMPYRITVKDGNRTTEWNVSQVYDWTKNLINEHELWDKVRPITILYHGTLKDLYPDIAVDENWHSNVLEALKNDSKFGLEEDEVLCHNIVPREGIVLRVDDDPVAEAYKLKAIAFLEHERGLMDKGDVDIEMTEGFVENSADE